MTIQNALPHFLSNLCYEKFLNDPKFWDADYDPEVDCRPSPPLASKLVYELVESKFFPLKKSQGNPESDRAREVQ